MHDPFNNCLIEFLALFSRLDVPANLGKTQADPADVPSTALVQRILPAPTAYEIE